MSVRSSEAPAPALRDDEEKRDREFGGCASGAPALVIQSEICGQPQNKGAVTGREVTDSCEFVLLISIFIRRILLCVVL